MASLCYDNAEYHCAYWWFVEVYDKNKEDNNKLNIDYTTFITKFVWSSYLIGEYIYYTCITLVSSDRVPIFFDTHDKFGTLLLS